MDSIRNIISNLYIYKFQNVDNLNMNKFGKKYLMEDSPSKEETIEKINQEITKIIIKLKRTKIYILILIIEQKIQYYIITIKNTFLIKTTIF